MASPVALGELVLVPSVDREDMRALVATPGEPAELLWSMRSSDSIPSLLAYEEKLYFLRDSGQLTVLDSATGEVEYGPERFEVLALAPEVHTLAVNELDDHFDASPAVAGNELFLRGKSHLFCVAEPAKK